MKKYKNNQIQLNKKLNRNIKPKAFTLIELLAVIVILAIIASIVIPMILGIIQRAKYKAFKESLNNAFHAYELYEVNNKLEDDPNADKTVDIQKLPLDSKNLKGEVTKNDEGDIELNDVTDGTYCAAGTKYDLSIIKGSCEDLRNKLDLKLHTVPGTTKIDVVVETVLGVPKNYDYKIEKEDYKKEINNQKTNKQTFNKLFLDTEYEITVSVRNNFGVEKILTKKERTLKTDPIKLELNPKDEYIKSGTVTITYPKINNVTYEYKWLEDTDWKDTTDLTLDVAAKNSTLLARVREEENVLLTNEMTINNIDDVNPVLNLSTVQKTTNSITIPYSIVEEHIKEVTCKYSNTDGSYSIDAQATNSACSLTNLDNTKTYYYQVCVTDEADNKVCKTGDTKPEVVVNPTITITHSPTNASATTTNGYSKEEIAKVTFSKANVTTPTYYIKSTLAGTTSVNVLASCTEENSKPKTCTNVSTNSIKANTWYKVSGNINVTYNTQTTSNQTIYAITFDGTNYSGASTGTTLKIDRTIPTISFVTNGNSAVAKTRSSVVNITEAHSGINVLKYKWLTSNTGSASDGTTFKTGGTVTTPANLNGTYYLCVYVTDKVGNSKNLCSGAFKLDNTAPTITFGTNGNSSYAKTQSSKITVTNDSYGATLNTGSYKYIWSTSNTATPTTAFTSGSTYKQSSGTGNYYLRATACDSLNNCTTKTSAVFKLDNSGPTCGSWSGTSTSWTNSNRTIYVGCSDSGSGCSSTSFSKTYSTTTKTATPTITIRDNLGNTTNCTPSSSLNIYVDKTAPEIELKNFNRQSSYMEASIVPSDSDSGIDYMRWKYDYDDTWWSNVCDNGSIFSGCRSTYRHENIVYFKAVDVAGNEGHTSMKVTFSGSSGGSSGSSTGSSSGNSSNSDKSIYQESSSCSKPTCTKATFESVSNGLTASFTCKATDSNSRIATVRYIYSEYANLDFKDRNFIDIGNINQNSYTRNSTWTTTLSATQHIDPPIKGKSYYLIYGAITDCGSQQIYVTSYTRSY